MHRLNLLHILRDIKKKLSGAYSAAKRGEGGTAETLPLPIMFLDNALAIGFKKKEEKG